MNLAPLINAGWLIIVHSAAAIIALLVGVVQFSGKKGTTTHRVLGWIWVVSMLVLAISSFWIQEIRVWGNFSYIHLLSILTIVSVPQAVLAARRGDIADHKKNMIITKKYIINTKILLELMKRCSMRTLN